MNYKKRILKVVWLSNFPLDLIEDQAKLTVNHRSHPSSWVYNLAAEFSRDNSVVQLHILSLTPYVISDTNFNWGDVNIWLGKCGIPFLHKGYPPYLRLDILTHYFHERSKLIAQIARIQPDIIHVFGTEYAYASVVKKFSDRTLVSIQGVFSDIFKDSSKISDKIQSKLEIEAINQGNYFSVRTNYDSNFVSCNNPKAEIFKIEEAIALNYFNSYWSMPSVVSFVFVGSVIQRKGIHVILNAIGLLNEQFGLIELKLIGEWDVEYRSDLEAIVSNSRKKAKLSFLGRQNSAIISEELSRSSIFILPSYFENSPNSLAEAMVVGTPCIASNVGGIPSMLEHGVDGLLFEAGDHQGLANAIIKMLSDKESMIKMSENAKTKARKKHFPPNVAAQTIAAYKSIVARNA